MKNTRTAATLEEAIENALGTPSASMVQARDALEMAETAAWTASFYEWPRASAALIEAQIDLAVEKTTI